MTLLQPGNSHFLRPPIILRVDRVPPAGSRQSAVGKNSLSRRSKCQYRDARHPKACRQAFRSVL